jgi:hypothetical protein
MKMEVEETDVQIRTGEEEQEDGLQSQAEDSQVENPEGTSDEAKDESKAPNIKFIGSQRINGKQVKSDDAPDWLRDGVVVFDDLPDSATQLEGFYYDRAQELCRAFPSLYKRITKIGE